MPISSVSGTFDAKPSEPSVPVAPSPDVFTEVTAVLNLTALNAHAGEPARLSNLAHSNVVISTNQSAQNAISNQQASTQLALATLGRTVNSVQNLGPLEARSSVDVLSNDEVAQAIAGLRSVISGGSGGHRPHGPSLSQLLALLKGILENIAKIEEQNGWLSGDGTAAHPYATEHGLYVTAPVTIAFPNLQPQEVDLSLAGSSLRAS